MTRIVIPIETMTKKNHSQIIKSKGRPMLIPSKQYLDYEKKCKPYIPTDIHITKSCNLCCVFYRGTKRRVDLSNLLNSICDMLVHYGVLEDDNCKIVYSFDGSRVCYDKSNPRVEIEIEELPINCW